MIRTPLRYNSKGIQGGIANTKHHARKLTQMVIKLAAEVDEWGFETWKEGSNTHVFATGDGRQFVFRPHRNKKEGYIGIRLWARFSPSVEMPLCTVYYDMRNRFSLGDFSRTIRAVAEDQPESYYAGLER